MRMRWSSSAPSSSPAARGPVMKLVYTVSFCPVPLRARSLTKTERSIKRGTSFSIPITTTWTGGTLVTSLALPSLVTVATVPGELRDPLPEVRLDDLKARVIFLEAAVQLNLLRRHALGLRDDLRSLSLREVSYVADDVLSVTGKEDVAAACLDGVGHLPQVAVEVGHRLLLDAVGPLPELGRLGQGIQDGIAPGHGLVGEKFDGIVELLVGDGPARPVVEALDAAGKALAAIVLRLAFAGRLPGLHVLNQPFRRRAPAQGGGCGCRVRCVSGVLRGASGSSSRQRSGCLPHSSPTPLSSHPPSPSRRRASLRRRCLRTRSTAPRSPNPGGLVPRRSKAARAAPPVPRAHAAGGNRSGKRLSLRVAPRDPSRPSRSQGNPRTPSRALREPRNARVLPVDP